MEGIHRCAAVGVPEEMRESDGRKWGGSARCSEPVEQGVRRLRQCVRCGLGCDWDRIDRPAGDVVQMAMKAGLLLNVTAGNVVRLVPPLIIRTDEADQMVDTAVAVVREFVN